MRGYNRRAIFLYVCSLVRSAKELKSSGPSRWLSLWRLSVSCNAEPCNAHAVRNKMVSPADGRAGDRVADMYDVWYGACMRLHTARRVP
jgi:hypothetical protein